jgi:hypothetical protein
MNIIELAKQAGLNHWTCEFYGEELKAFEALVAAAEREECAKLCDENAKNSSNPMNFAENCATDIRARGTT